MINQLWGPVFNLTGDGGFRSLSHAWLFVKTSNLIEILLVIILFIGGMFIHLPGGDATEEAHGS
jgi:hypothetical protein